VSPPPQPAPSPFWHPRPQRTFFAPWGPPKFWVCWPPGNPKGPAPKKHWGLPPRAPTQETRAPKSPKAFLPRALPQMVFSQTPRFPINPHPLEKNLKRGILGAPGPNFQPQPNGPLGGGPKLINPVPKVSSPKNPRGPFRTPQTFFCPPKGGPKGVPQTKTPLPRGPQGAPKAPRPFWKSPPNPQGPPPPKGFCSPKG